MGQRGIEQCLVDIGQSVGQRGIEQWLVDIGQRVRQGWSGKHPILFI